MAFTYKVSDIVLAEFPFTDKEETKTRPVLIIAIVSNYIWGLMLSSSPDTHDDGFKYQISKNEVTFSFDNLRSHVRTNVIQTIDLKCIKKKMGSMHNEAFERITEQVKSILNF